MLARECAPGYANTHAPATHTAHRGRSGPRYRPVSRPIVRASRMSYCEIGRRAQNSIKLFRLRVQRPTEEAQGRQEEAKAAHNRGRIELSALNSAFYARGCSPGLSTPPDGDIINVNCTNCTVIARRGPFSLPLSLSFSSLFATPLVSYSVPDSASSFFLRAPAVPLPLRTLFLLLLRLPRCMREAAFASQSRR